MNATTLIHDESPPTDDGHLDIRNVKVGLGMNGVRLSPEEFDAIEDYDEEYQYELVQGVLVVNPTPLAQERGPNELLGRLLLNHGEQHAEGSCLDDTLPEEYIRTTHSLRRADRAIWTGLGRVPRLKIDLPTIVVEFVSEGRRSWRRDYIEKRDEYLALGIAEYWVFDRFQKSLTVYRMLANGERNEKKLGEADVYRTERLPGFELPVGRILQAASKWNV